MGSKELAQFLIQNRPENALTKELKAGIAEVEIKEGVKAQMERGKRDDSAAAIAADGVRRANELDSKALIAAADQESKAQQAAKTQSGGP